MDIVLAVLRYVFVATTLVGATLVVRAIVRLARDKDTPTTGAQS